MATISARDIASLERAVSNQLATYSQNSQSVAMKLPPIKVTALNQKFPVFEGMMGYAPDSNSGIGGDRTQVLLPPSSYKSAAVFYTDRTYTITLAAKRSMTVLDDPNGAELVKLVANGNADSKLVTMDYNIHNAVKNQTYNNGTNLFNIGNINADTAGGSFRDGINNAISVVKKALNGFNSAKKLMIVIPEKAWFKLTASQKLANNLMGYAQPNTNINMQTISAIFSENAGINVDVSVAGLRFLEAKYSSGQSELIWGEDLELYVFATTDSLLADRASLKRLAGMEALNVSQAGLATTIQFYCDYGYYVDVPEAFAKVKFTVA